MMEFKTTEQLAFMNPVPPAGNDWMLVSVIHIPDTSTVSMYWQRSKFRTLRRRNR